jgi:hypothetical protein
MTAIAAVLGIHGDVLGVFLGIVSFVVLLLILEAIDRI